MTNQEVIAATIYPARAEIVRLLTQAATMRSISRRCFPGTEAHAGYVASARSFLAAARAVRSVTHLPA